MCKSPRKTSTAAPNAHKFSTNLVIMLGMMQVSKKVPFEDPQVLNGVRILYVVSNLIIFAIYYYIGMQIKKKKGMLHEKVKSRNWLTILSQISPC